MKNDEQLGRQVVGFEEAVPSGFVYLTIFAAIVALTGGASRYDEVQVVPLRFLSALLIIPALYYLNIRIVREGRVLFTLLISYILLVALQWLPVPPVLWVAPPGRDAVSELDMLLDQAVGWRPLVMSPLRGWNVLGGVIVPTTALLLAVVFKASALTLLRLIAFLGILNAALALFQETGFFGGGLYFYEVTNKGSPVGIFANENHSAVFGACSLLVVTSLGLKAYGARVSGWERFIYPIAYFLILFAALIGGSRAGLAASFGAVFVSMAMLALALNWFRARSHSEQASKVMEGRAKAIFVCAFATVFLVAATFIGLDRAPAFQDIASQDNLSDLRLSLLSVIFQMFETHWLLGSGFGSFEQVYKIYESPEMLRPEYINQAHNDWAQFLIEGGLFAGFLMGALLLWLAKAVLKLTSMPATRPDALFWMGLFLIVGAASLVDYPLRTPVFQLVMVWSALALSKDSISLRAMR